MEKRIMCNVHILTGQSIKENSTAVTSHDKYDRVQVSANKNRVRSNQIKTKDTE